jgi:hypothetical protein
MVTLYDTTIKKFIRSQWLFPALLLVPLIILTLTKISGTSIGYFGTVTGFSQPDRNLIAGEVRPVRSDEWLVNTQMTVVQAVSGYPRINPNIGSGQDMSVILDVPYKEWSSLFRPQNWSFFLMPLENAFAFKWWLLAWAMAVVTFLFVTRIGGMGKGLGAVAAIGFTLSPYFWWWYQSVTVAPVIYSLFAIVIIVYLFKAQSTRARILYGAILTFTLTCFGMAMYPPFQIPCAIAATALLVGLGLEGLGHRGGLLRAKPAIITLIASMVIAAAFLGTFILTRSDTIHAITSTVYPGKREIVSGGFSPTGYFASFLSYRLQDSTVSDGYLQNQSEASNFLPLAPLLLLPSFFLLVSGRRRGSKTDWPLLFVSAVTVVFLARMFIAWPNLPYKLLLLNKVPSNRLLIGLGLLALIQIALIYRHSRLYSRELPTTRQAGSAIIAFGILLLAGFKTHIAYPSFTPGLPIIVALAAILSVAIWFLLKSKTTIFGLSILLAFGFFSTYKIQPAYRGLDPITKSTLIDAIAHDSHAGTWAAFDSLALENIPELAGKQSLSGVETYPQLDYWKELDSSPSAEKIYNRYAHITYKMGPKDGVELAGGDHVSATINPCGDFARLHIGHIITPQPPDSPCLKLERTVIDGGWTYYILSISPKS